MPPDDRSRPLGDGSESAGQAETERNSDRTPLEAVIGVDRTVNPWSEVHVAEQLADALQGRYLWSAKLGWLRWDGRRWAPDGNERVLEDIRRWVIDWVQSLVPKVDGDDLRRAAAFKGVHRIEALARLVRRMSGIAVEPDELDTHIGLLNCLNGVVDLRTGELLPHDPALLITKLAGAEYKPGARHDDVDAALSVLEPGPRSWVQRFFGHAATGEASEDIVAVFDGGGGNGKTTIVVGVSAALGDHAAPIARELVLRTNRDEHPTSYAELHKIRLAFIEELPEDGVLRTEAVKALSGGGTVRARYMHKDAWSFKLTHSLLIATNNRPRILTIEDATWRRLRLIPFPFRYTGDGDQRRPGDLPKDKGLRDRVRTGKAQQEALLAWIVAGAVQWYATGIGEDDTIARGTAEWLVSEDTMRDFLAATFVPDVDGEVTAADLYGHYTQWSSSHGHGRMSQTLFGRRFKEHALAREWGVEKRTSDGVRYTGLRFQSAIEWALNL